LLVVYSMLGVIESLDYLKGLSLAEWVVITEYEDIEKFGFPCYLKADVFGHKTELGAVMKCNNFEEARKNLLKLHKNFSENRIIAQENFEGIEMIVGLKKDAVFGKLLVVGFGGIFTEVKKDVSFRALPVSRRDIVSMIHDLEGFEIFKARGKKYDMEKFVTLVGKVAYLADKKDIKELDLNPVIVGEKESKIIDARIEVD